MKTALILSLLIIITLAIYLATKGGIRRVGGGVAIAQVTDIQLKAIPTGGGNFELKVQPQPGKNNCKKKTDGCRKIPLSNIGEITFELLGPANPGVCNPSGSNQFRLTKVQMADFPGDFDVEPLQWIQDDFVDPATGSMEDPSSGTVVSAAPGDNKLTLTIRDNNQTRGVAFYRVVAESCDPASALAPIATDPRVENDGL